MIIKHLFLSICGLILFNTVQAQTDLQPVDKIEIQIITSEIPDTLPSASSPEKPFKYRESKRFVAAVLCLTLGPFGMHRLYLGTEPRVAAAYSVTLGGVGVIPVVDLLLITFSKDISRFKNNDKVIMWGK